MSSMNTEPEEESSTNHVSVNGRSGRVKIEDLLSASNEDERTLAEHYYLTGYPTPTLSDDILNRYIYHRMVRNKDFYYYAFLGFGLGNFMSYAAHFCKYEAANKAEIISVGSGAGVMEREIISTYRKHFGEEIKITLVDPNPGCEVDFKKVDDLMEARQEAVGNCVLLIIWPDPMERNDGYDIDAIEKLQPHAALVLYDPRGVSASDEFNGFLHDGAKETVEPIYGCSYDKEAFDLEHYAAEKVTGLEVYFEAGYEFEKFGRKLTTTPALSHYCLRLIKLKKLSR